MADDKKFEHSGGVPDIPSDIAEWGYRPDSAPLLSELSAEELAKVEKLAEKYAKRRRELGQTV